MLKLDLIVVIVYSSGDITLPMNSHDGPLNKLHHNKKIITCYKTCYKGRFVEVYD